MDAYICSHGCSSVFFFRSYTYLLLFFIVFFSFCFLQLICVCISICERIVRIFRQRHGFMYVCFLLLMRMMMVDVCCSFYMNFFGCVARKILAYLTEAGFLLIRLVPNIFTLCTFPHHIHIHVDCLIPSLEHGNAADGLNFASHFEPIRDTILMNIAIMIKSIGVSTVSIGTLSYKIEIC